MDDHNAGMGVLCFYDFKRNKKREFIRVQVRCEGTIFLFEELSCKQFGDQVASEELDRQEFDAEQAARSAYEEYLRSH